MERVETDAEVGAGDVGDEGGSSLEVIAEGAVGCNSGRRASRDRLLSDLR
jgi:hypothetical protein